LFVSSRVGWLAETLGEEARVLNLCGIGEFKAHAELAKMW